MDFTGKIVDLSNSYLTGNPKITLELNEKENASLLYDELHDAEKLSIKISRFRVRRSLDSNAYAWVLMGKLATKLNKPKEEIYRDFIKDIGDNYEVVCVKNEAVEKLCSGWEHNGIGWQTDTLPSKIDGCTNVMLYYGSSTYDKAQMGALLESIIFECKEQGIPTETPEQVANMMSLWGE